jgi:hypothetical protein
MNIRSWLFLCNVTISCTGAMPAFAQISAPTASLEMPDLAIPAKEFADERKYFILHKPGVTVEQATDDLSFCWRFLPIGAFRSIPAFVPWSRTEGLRKAPTANGFGPYGLVGFAIGAMIAGPLERSKRQSRIFRCMVPRGYGRYRTSEAVWKTMNTGDPAKAIHMQALIAAGPVPPTPRILP